MPRAGCGVHAPTGRRIPWPALCFLVLAFTVANPALGRVDLEPYLGLYQGSFASALTEDPEDDLNFNPCNPATRDCSLHQDPHIDILLSLVLDGKGRLDAGFYRSELQLGSGRELDLLGRGCRSRVGRLEKLTPGKRGEAVRWTARFGIWSCSTEHCQREKLNSYTKQQSRLYSLRYLQKMQLLSMEVKSHWINCSQYR